MMDDDCICDSLVDDADPNCPEHNRQPECECHASGEWDPDCPVHRTDPAPSIPESWDLITAGDGRTYEAVENNGEFRWRPLFDGHPFHMTDAEILALGPVRRAVVITLTGVRTDRGGPEAAPGNGRGERNFPEGEQVLDRQEFAFAAARGKAHRLVRADEVAATIRQAKVEALRDAADGDADLTFGWRHWLRQYADRIALAEEDHG